jgi:hypothetical protein
MHFSETRQFWSILVKNARVVDLANSMQANGGQF